MFFNQKIFNEPGLKFLSLRRWFRRFSIFYKTKITQLPSYLYDLKVSITTTRSFNHIDRSSLIYNTSDRHQRHECDSSDTIATQCDISDASETQGTRVQHKCGTSATRTTQVRHERNILILITTHFSHPYTYYISSERLQEK